MFLIRLLCIYNKNKDILIYSAKYFHACKSKQCMHVQAEVNLDLFQEARRYLVMDRYTYRAGSANNAY